MRGDNVNYIPGGRFTIHTNFKSQYIQISNCTPETYLIYYVSYTLLKKKKASKRKVTLKITV